MTRQVTRPQPGDDGELQGRAFWKLLIISIVLEYEPTKKRKVRKEGNFPTYKPVLEFHYRFYVFEAFLLFFPSRNTHKMHIEE